MTDRELMQQALEALEYIHEGANNQGPHTGISWRCVSNKAEPAITALRERLAQPTQEPVAWQYNGILHEFDPSDWATGPVTPLYTSPPASKPWVGLTDEERNAILDREFKQWWSRHDAVCRAIEAKLKEKNG